MNIFGREMTQQQVFDEGVAAILKQGKPAYDQGTGCSYRAQDGCKCLIGHLMPDDRYDPQFEGSLASTAAGFDSFTDNGQFLNDLQDCHDTAARNSKQDDRFMERFQHYARDFASQYELSAEVLDQC